MIAGELTYGGISLLHDQEFRANGFLQKYLRLDDLRCLVPELQSRVNGRLHGHPSNPLKVGSPVPQWPARPSIRLNQLYWPTGASRWAEGYFVASTTNKNLIVAAAYDNENTPLTLKVTHDIGDTKYLFQASMHLLPPRPLTCVGIDSVPRQQEQLWLIPLVDERYYWRFKHFTETVLQDTAWSELIEWLATDLGVEIDAGDVNSAYLNPDPESFLQYENAACMLDALAFSVGMRFIRWQDGDCYLMDWESTETTLNTNLAGTWWQIAGDVISEPLPNKVEVAFQKMKHYRPCGNERYVAESDDDSIPSSMTGRDIVADSQRIYSTLLADFTDGSADPDNLTDITTFVTQITEDFYLSRRRAYDISYAGAKPWSPCGYDDHLLYNFGAEHEIPKVDAFTSVMQDSATTVLQEKWERLYWVRVQTMPYNFYPEHQLSQKDTLTIIGPAQVAKTTSSTVPARSSDTPGREDVNLYEFDESGDLTPMLDVNDAQMVVEAINIFSGEVAVTTFIQIKDGGCGNWLIDTEDCGA